MWRARDAQVPMGHNGRRLGCRQGGAVSGFRRIEIRDGIELIVDGGVTLKVN
jgi:hypothetical protein